MFAQKLSEHIQKRFGSKLNLKQQAEVCGVGDEHFRQFMGGQSNPPSDDKIVEVAGKLQLSEEETKELLILAASDRAKEPKTKSILARALGPAFVEAMKKRTAAAHDFTKAPDNVIALKAETHTIPIYTTIKAGNGEMGITDGESDGEISITEEYYKQKVFALRVSGDSMAPELYDGEIAIFKPINGDPTREKDIYAVEVEGWASWAVKFVRPDPSGNVLLISANPTYQVKEINPKVSQVTLRGKLIESRRIRR